MAKYCTHCEGECHSSKAFDLHTSMQRQEFELGAAKGCAESINNLGDWHYAEENYPKAFKLFQRAAKLGHGIAIINLASCYDYGFGVASNHKKCLKLYRQAIELGYAAHVFNAVDDGTADTLRADTA